MIKRKPTPQETAEYLKEFMDGGEMCCCCGDDIVIAETAIEALEKQMPKKVNINGFFYAGCPNCNKDLYHKYQFCPDCGQALDWSEEDE